MKRAIAGLMCFFMFLNLNITMADNIDSDYIQNLVQLEIVDADDFREDEYLTNKECFNFLLQAVGENRVNNLEHDWKYDGFKKLLGDRPDEQKEIICKMSSLIVLREEWKDIDFEADCTREMAVTYCIRAVVDINGCDWSPATYESTKEVYEDAYARGIIESSDTTDSDNPITRGGFLEMLNKTLYVEYTRGGYSGTWEEKMIDRFTVDPDPIIAPTYEEKMTDFMANAQLASAEEMNLAKSRNVEDYGLLDGFTEEVDMNQDLTRAELAVIISRLMGYSVAGIVEFEDFDRGAWYGDDFNKLAFYNIIIGFNGYARPDDLVTCEEANIMLSRALMIEDYKGLSGEPSDTVSFGEIFAALDNMIDVCYELPRAYDNKQTIIDGNVFIMSPDTVLKNTVINGNLYITDKVPDLQPETDEQGETVVRGGYLALDNVTVKGDLVLPYSSMEKFYLIDCDIKSEKRLREGVLSILYITYRGDAPTLDSGKNLKLNDDFSLTWELPDNTLELGGQWMGAYDEDGKKSLGIVQAVVTRKLMHGICWSL